MNPDPRNIAKLLSDEVLQKLTVFKGSTLPHLYYHLAHKEFTEFSPRMKGRNTGLSNTVHGFFFTDKKSLSVLKEENPLTFGDIELMVRLNIKKPINLSINAIFSNTDQAGTIWEALTGESLTNETALETLNEEIGLGELGDLNDGLNSAAANRIFRRNGYDGIISRLGKNHTEYIAFKPEQIQIVSREAIMKSYYEGKNQVLVDAINSLNRGQEQHLEQRNLRLGF